MKDGDKNEDFVKESFIQTVKLYLSKSGVSYILISSVVTPPKMVCDLPANGGVIPDKGSRQGLAFRGV